MDNTDLRPIQLKIVTKKGETKGKKFEGIPLGRSWNKRSTSDRFKRTVEIYQIAEEEFIIYAKYHDKDGNLSLADYVKISSLDLFNVQSSLKQAGLYSGPFYSEAVYHAFDALQKLEHFS